MRTIFIIAHKSSMHGWHSRAVKLREAVSSIRTHQALTVHYWPAAALSAAFFAAFSAMAFVSLKRVRAGVSRKRSVGGEQS